MSRSRVRHASVENSEDRAGVSGIVHNVVEIGRPQALADAPREALADRIGGDRDPNPLWKLRLQNKRAQGKAQPQHPPDTRLPAATVEQIPVEVWITLHDFGNVDEPYQSRPTLLAAVNGGNQQRILGRQAADGSTAQFIPDGALAQVASAEADAERRRCQSPVGFDRKRIVGK